MVATASPTVLKRYVALELRKLREGAGITRAQSAEHLHCVVSAITHLEIMRNLPRPLELRALLELYGVPERTDDFQQLVTAARKGKDWWEPFGDAAPKWLDLLLGMEASAAQIDSYDAMTIPGLFQTHRYARALVRSGEPELPDADVEARVELRLARQQVLTREPEPPTVWTVLDESALLRTTGDEKVMREQMTQLLKLGDLPNVTIQVLPLAAGMHPGMNGTFMVLTFPPELAGDPGVAYTESRIGGIYYEDAAEIMRYRDTMTRVQLTARSPEESREVIARHSKE